MWCDSPALGQNTAESKPRLSAPPRDPVLCEATGCQRTRSAVARGGTPKKCITIDDDVFHRLSAWTAKRTQFCGGKAIKRDRRALLLGTRRCAGSLSVFRRWKFGVARQSGTYYFIDGGRTASPSCLGAARRTTMWEHQ